MPAVVIAAFCSKVKNGSARSPCATKFYCKNVATLSSPRLIGRRPVTSDLIFKVSKACAKPRRSCERKESGGMVLFVVFSGDISHLEEP